jgi:membrane associated rhomboid family serine protease
MASAGRPTVQTLTVIGVVYLVQQLAGLFGPLEAVLFVLSGPVGERPWALVTSVYAHASLPHLVGNAVVLAVVGPLVARRTTTVRFHVFFLAAGALAGVGEIVIGGLVGPPRGVLGASGAVLALAGYLLAGTVVSTRVVRRLTLSPRVQLAVFAVVVVGLTLVTSGPKSAVFGHATGLTVGLVTGRFRVLDTGTGRSGFA